MPNSISAKPMPGPQRNPADDDKPLNHDTKPSAGLQPHLRIVHSADRSQEPPPWDRMRRASDEPPAMLDRTVQAQIGRLLRDVFADVAGEPVPKRFVTLLAQLESKEKPAQPEPKEKPR